MEHQTFNDNIINMLVILLICTFNIIASQIIIWWGGGLGREIKFERLILTTSQKNNCIRRAIVIVTPKADKQNKEAK